MFDHLGSPPTLWRNGPTPGGFYNFPAIQTKPNEPITHSKSPVTTATSVIAIAYDKGVVMAGDLLASYGSLARYKNCPRILQVNENILLGASGDYADFQYIKGFIEQKIIDEDCMGDNIKLKPKSLYCWLTRVMYQRRSKFDPFWNNIIVAGLQDGEPFLGQVDKLGTAYTDRAICTGYAAHIVQPIIRDFLDKNPNPTLTEAKALVMKCMEILYYRDARSYSKFQIGIMDKEAGSSIEGPLACQENWDIALLAD
nr:unnamed protein product [Callosobruchus analis]